METIGASQSLAAARHFSSGTMSFRFVEYSRIRPQPVHVKLHVCNGSSCKTIANFGVLRTLCLMMWPAIFADNANGNRIVYRASATCLTAGVSGKVTSFVAGGGLALSNPGRKNDAGETLWVLLIPLQPAVKH